ncbi:MAG: DUF1345 domain-containing protein [Burkholderiales bacterium]|nr:DUF1345 domain-containing protein [Burkholderiales bacterium]MDE2274951.1 DUF1345 domain-containing protein [Burkholderiales bacterium]
MSSLRRIAVMVHSRPRLWFSVLLGVAVYLWLPTTVAVRTPTRALLAWNAGALLYLALALEMGLASSATRMHRRALREDDGRLIVLSLVVFAAVAVLLAVASQLGGVKDLQGSAKRWHMGLAALTVFTSWMFTQVLFALHYAHDFYLARSRGRPDPLDFPGTTDPGYGDFFYFASIIGTSGQTADVAFNGGDLRPVGVLHCILAFFFNTTVLALTINIAAGLF